MPTTHQLATLLTIRPVRSSLFQAPSALPVAPEEQPLDLAAHSAAGRNGASEAYENPDRRHGRSREAPPVVFVLLAFLKTSHGEEASHANGRGDERTVVDQVEAVQAVPACDRVSHADDDREQQNLAALPHCVVLRPPNLHLHRLQSSRKVFLTSADESRWSQRRRGRSGRGKTAGLPVAQGSGRSGTGGRRRRRRRYRPVG